MKRLFLVLSLSVLSAHAINFNLPSFGYFSRATTAFTGGVSALVHRISSSTQAFFIGAKNTVSTVKLPNFTRKSVFSRKARLGNVADSLIVARLPESQSFGKGTDTRAIAEWYRACLKTSGIKLVEGSLPVSELFGADVDRKAIDEWRKSCLKSSKILTSCVPQYGHTK